MQTSSCGGRNLPPLCTLEGLFQAGSISGGSAAFCYVSGGTFLTLSFGTAPHNEPKIEKYIPHLKQNVSVDERTLKFTLKNK